MTRISLDELDHKIIERLGHDARVSNREIGREFDLTEGTIRSLLKRLLDNRVIRVAAVTNAGVIPDQFDSDVILLPEGQRIGSLNEDFAFESLPGDIFQLGNAAYRIAKVETGKVLVQDVNGQPPTLPFWLGE